MYVKDHKNISHLNNIFQGFKIKANCIGMGQYRHFSFYDVELAYGCRINDIMRYTCEIAIAMRTKSNFTVKPIPEKGIVRLQTLHTEASPLLYNSYSTKIKYDRSLDYFLPLLLGETSEGEPLWLDLSICPHLIIAGSTGSGKSTTLHTIIANLLGRTDIGLSLIDTKQVEFNIYKRIYTNNKPIVATTYSTAVGLLDVMYEEMDLRYEFFSENGKVSIHDFPFMLKHVMIIDEVSDLFLQQKNKEFEKKLIRLAQKARAAGIYIIIATQRPSVDVLTGLIKANFPARLACKVSSKVDSRVVLDSHGAENLNGKGDAILKTCNHDMIRFQVAYTDPMYN